METLRRYYIGLLLFCSTFIFCINANATHVAGGYIEMLCTGTPGQYTIRLVLYRDCSGIPLGTGNKSVHLTSSCGDDFDISCSYTNSFEVSQVCAADAPNTTCRGGSVPGYQQYVFEATVNLGACDHWTAEYELSARNSITNIIDADDTYFHVTSEFYTNTDNCNTSPEVTAQPQPYVCMGNPISYNLGAVEPDGDSIVYKLVPATDRNGNNLNYSGGYSAGQPIPGTSIDPQTGTVTFTPNTSGNFLFVIQVIEYNSNGDVVTVTNYEYQTTVINCNNHTPQPPTANGGAGITNTSGSIIKNSPTSLTLCKGNTGCFDVVFTDEDAGQTLTASSNISSVFPGASVTKSGTNPLTIHVCVDPSATAGMKSLSFMVEDDACPLVGQNTFAMTVDVVDPGTADVTTTTEICGGTDKGTATIKLTGSGSGPFTYAISGPKNDNSSSTSNTSYTFSDLPPGNYSYTVNTPVGCDLNGTFTIVPGPDLQANITGTNVSCNGLNDGSSTVTPTSGDAPYNYVWQQGGTPIGQTSNTASGLAPGSYDVLVTDKNGCTTTKSITITEPDALAGNLTPTDALCNGSSDGEIDVTGVTGGTSPYQYKLNSGSYQGGTNFPGLAAGNYQVTIKDKNGCTTQLTTTVGEPNKLTLTIDNTNDATCNGSTGSFQVSASGGTPNYSYSSGGANSTNGQFPNMSAGSHNVTVTDGNGCSATITVNVGSVAAPDAYIDNKQDISCFGGNNGKVIIGSNNAPAPVSYSLDGGAGQSSNQFTGLSKGPHTVILTDANGCTASVSFTINEPTVVSFNTTVTDASCNSTCDGKIVVSANGGTSPYQYSSDNGLTFSTSNQLTGLCAGGVDVVVKDDQGCLSNQTITVNQPATISTTLNPTDPICHNGSDGEITVNASGGTPNYHYSVDGSPLQNGNTLTGLTAGPHTIHLEDDNGCSLDSTISLGNPPSMVIDTTWMHPSNCHTANGEIKIEATGPHTISDYQITNGGAVNQTNTTGIFTGLNAGAYKFYVTDVKGCVDSIFFGINDVEMDGQLLNTTDLTCYESNDGSAEVKSLKGNNPISFELDNSGSPIVGNPYNVSDPLTDYHYTFTGLAAGSHIVTIYDYGNCVYTVPFNLVQPDSIDFSANITDASCFGGSDGEIEVINVTGGNGTYQYGEGGGFFVTYQNSPIFTGFAKGDYKITVKDKNGCTNSRTFHVDEAPKVTFTENIFDLNCHNDGTGAIQIVASGGTGTYQYSNNNGTTYQNSNNFTGLSAGSYHIWVKDANGCTSDSIIQVNQPDTVQATYTPISTLCFNSCDGKIAIQASGGVSPYIYSPNNGNTWTSVDTLFNLCAGSHTVMVKDDHGCKITATQTVTEPTKVTLNATQDPTTCEQPNGEIHLTAGGGTPGYVYSIDGGVTYGTNSDFFNLNDSTYDVIIKDDNGCTSNNSLVVIPNLASPEIDFLTGTPPLCHGDANGKVVVNASGGNGTIQYAIDGGGFQTSSSFTGLTVGSHTVVIKDTNGCTDTKSITLTEPAALTFSSTPTALTCFENSTGKIQVTATGGTPAYQYSFDNGTTFSPSPINNFIAAGTYNIVVKDANGCTATGQETVTEPNKLVVTDVTITDALCKTDSNGVIAVTATGGTTPYSYSWDDINQQTTSSATGLPAGTFNVIITDDNGCTTDTSGVVNEPDSVEITTINVVNVDCNGNLNGEITINSPTGVQYSIDGGNTFQNSNNFTGLAAGDYPILVKDADGCKVIDSATIWQPTPVTLSLPNDTTVCYSYNMDIIATPGGGVQPYTYQWTNGNSTDDTLSIIATQTETYSLQIIDDNGCPSSLEDITVTVLPKVDIDVLKDTSICPGSSVTLTATGSNGLPGYSYKWSTGDTLTNITVSPNVQTVYTATITDQCGQQAIDSAIVSLFNPPAPIIGISDTTGCAPATITFTSTANASNLTGHYIWTINGQKFLDTTVVDYTFTQPGCYDVSLEYETNDGCMVDTTYGNFICVDDYPDAHFSYSPQHPTILDNDVNFINYSNGATGYHWTFQGEGSSDEVSPSVTFNHVKANSGVKVCLKAYTPLGCADTICKNIIFKDEFMVYVPNTFTPDNDEYNPVFLPKFPPDVVIDKYLLTIFNRWGEILFKSYDYQVGWDGTYNGHVAKQGVYIWKITVKEEGNNESSRSYTGHVSLLR